MPLFLFPRHARASLCLVCALLIAGGLPCAFAEDASPRIVVQSAYQHGAISPPDVPTSPRVKDDYFTHAVFVGDSLADGLALHSPIPGLQILARIGLSPRTARTNTTFKNNGKPVTLAEKLPAMRPDAVYLWLGSNGLDKADAQQVLRDYDRLLNLLLAALPETPFFLLEATPVRPLSGKGYQGFTNERIDAFNRGLREMAIRHNVYLLPVNALLRDAYGFLEEAHAASDGIHLQESAYKILADYLYTHTLSVPDGSN